MLMFERSRAQICNRRTSLSEAYPPQSWIEHDLGDRVSLVRVVPVNVIQWGQFTRNPEHPPGAKMWESDLVLKVSK
jgi:hypothetical protein